MPFKKMEKTVIPPRHWILVGYPGSGKSTFSTQMRGPLLPIDADHRYQEVAYMAQADVYELSTNPADAVDPEAIYRLLNENMPGSGTRTIIVDSLTTIIVPKVTEAIMESDARRERNKDKGRGEKRENLISPFKEKALAMRLLQDAVTKWGTDTLWIYHLQDSRNEDAAKVTRPILSETERARLYRSVNMELHIVEDKNRRGVKVVWARRGRAGMILWDDTGKWEGMPERIEQAVYAGLSVEAQDRIEQETPATFPTEEAAIDWGQGQGVFKNVEHARNAFSKFKREQDPELGLEELSPLWVMEVARRKLADREPGLETFCEGALSRLPFFQTPEEVEATIKALGMAYAPESEQALFELLTVHIESIPTFEDMKTFLARLKKDFNLEEDAAKAILRDAGFTGWPKNGGAKEKSRRMYVAVKDALAARQISASRRLSPTGRDASDASEAAAVQVEEEDIPF